MMHHLLSLGGRILTQGKLNILIYHQVPEEHDAMRPSEPDQAQFRWQMELIKKYYTPISLSDAIQCLKENSLPSNAVCITFDDGYINNLTVAAPILNALKIPATVFVATDFLHGQNMWNDRVMDIVADTSFKQLDLSSIALGQVELSDIEQRRKLAYKIINAIKYQPIDQRNQLIDKIYQDNGQQEYASRMMSEQQVQMLFEQGIEIGAHTQSHPILSEMPLEQQQQQIVESKAILEQIIGQPLTGFAYPNGKWQKDYNQESRDIVASTGFSYAVSTNWGVSTKDTDTYQLNRFSPWDKSALKFHLRLLRNAVGI